MPTHARTTVAFPILRGAPADIALVADEGAVTYGELQDRIDARRVELGSPRRLLLLPLANEIEPVVTALAALAGGHPAILTDGAADSAVAARSTAALAERYRPAVSLVRAEAGWELEHAERHPELEPHPELAMMLSTSGSTGAPKLVRLSRGNIVSNAASIVDYLGITPADRAVTALPLHYSYGLSVLTSHLLAGASLLLTSRSVIDEEFWCEFAEAGCTSFAGVPHSFDLLEASGFRDRELPSLRYVTQAGGRLAPDRIREFARLGERKGFCFFVMYGQTEATARMAYLPPTLARTRAETIGVAVPGGELRIDEPDASGVGELVYRGSNVMMGYAEHPDDLAKGAELDELRTGDLARLHDDGLIEIVGRASRFVKLFGLRIDLDRIERLLRDEGIAARAVDLDETLHVLVTRSRELERIGSVIAEETGLPRYVVHAHVVESLPLTSSGKTDYAALRRIAGGDRDAGAASRPLEPTSDRVESVRALFAVVLDRADAGPDDSFAALEGDSLAYVEVSLRLERLLGDLPRDWPARSARELAAGATTATRAHSAPRLADGTRVRRLAAVETPVALRALAIVLIVGTHANLLGLQGGAHLLLGVLGYNLARLQLADVPRRARLRGLVRGALSVGVPAVLWIGVVALITGEYAPTTVALLNGLLGDGAHWSEQWRFWFIEAAVGSILVAAILVAVPALDRLERRLPFATAGAAVLATLAVRLVAVGGITAGATERYQVFAVAWLIALGWLIARAVGRAQRLAVSVVVLVTVPGFFGDPLREAVVVVGLIVLIWARAVPIPRLFVPAIGLVATTSLFTYLVHWELYPLLEDDAPLAATLLSFAAGIAYWALYSAGRRLVRRRPGPRRAGGGRLSLR